MRNRKVAAIVVLALVCLIGWYLGEFVRVGLDVPVIGFGLGTILIWLHEEPAIAASPAPVATKKEAKDA